MFHVEHIDRKTMLRYTIFLLVVLLSCGEHNTRDEVSKGVPNIVWIIAEDLSPVIPSFGDSTILTPNLSRLAAEGVCYDRVFSTSGVCSPSRAAIATGMYPTRLGANHMRTGPWFTSSIPESFLKSYAKNAMPPGIRPYQAVPPEGTLMMSEYLRQAGYYCSNNAKEDYQFMNGLMAWDESSTKAHWRKKAEGQPFFSVFNINVTHESQIWGRSTYALQVEEDLDVPVPPYLPTTDSALIDIRRMYSNIIEMDQQVGEILDQLEQDNLLDDTIIFWYTDHGGPLPRQKRMVYDAGLHVPMIVRYPGKRRANTRDSTLISFIDFAPTVLSLAGIEPPRHMDGTVFLGTEAAPRDYIHAASDRFDEGPSDRIRAVRDNRYKLIKYYDRELPMFYRVAYREFQPIMRELYHLREAGNLDAAQALWFREQKPSMELFDTKLDPHELEDLADNPAYAQQVAELSAELERWLNEEEDLNMLPEQELIGMFTDEDGNMHVTADPTIELKSKTVILSSTTEGASLGYKLSSDSTNASWTLYDQPFEIQDTVEVSAVAHRLGYVPSKVVSERLMFHVEH